MNKLRGQQSSIELDFKPDVPKEEENGPKNDQHTGTLYIIENPDPDQEYYMEEFDDKTNDQIVMTSINVEPETINWEHMDGTSSITIQRIFSSIIFSMCLVGLTILAQYIFNSIFIADVFDNHSFFKHASFNCATNVTMEEAYQSVLT